MFAELELILEKVDQSFQPIRQKMKEDKQRGYTVVHAPCTFHCDQKMLLVMCSLDFSF